MLHIMRKSMSFFLTGVAQISQRANTTIKPLYTMMESFRLNPLKRGEFRGACVLLFCLGSLLLEAQILQIPTSREA